MKKILKFIGKTILVLVGLAVVLVLTMPLWFGPVMKPTANSVVPKYTKTSFNMGHLSLNPYTGRFELGDMRLGNPPGYSEPDALTVDKIVVDVAMTTIFDKCLHIEEVTVDGLFISLVKGGENNVDNIDQIQYNIAGGKEKYEENKAKEEAEKEKAEKETAKAEDKDGDEGSKKVVIDVLTLNNIKIKYGMVTIPVPSITLKDLGKDSDGLAVSELFEQIWNAVLKAAYAVGDGAKVLGGVLMSGAEMLGEGAGKAVDAVSDGAGKAVDAVSDGAGKAVDAVSERAGKAMDAIGAGKAVDAVSDGAGKAVDAVKDGAGKAADAIKGLFN